MSRIDPRQCPHCGGVGEHGRLPTGKDCSEARGSSWPLRDRQLTITPTRYRWDVYGNHIKDNGPWYSATPGKLKRAFRAMLMPTERIRVEFDNGQQVVFRLRDRRSK